MKARARNRKLTSKIELISEGVKELNLAELLADAYILESELYVLRGSVRLTKPVYRMYLKRLLNEFERT